ncbi:MAG: RDD family protein [Microcoleaceae cyanobacterium]
MEKATFLNRLISWIIDYVVVAIVSYLLITIGVLLLGLIGQTTGGLPKPFAFLLTQGVFIPGLLFSFLYFGYFWSTKAQSIGMGMMNIKVIKKNGENMSFLIAGLRGTVGYWLSGILLFIGYLWALFDAQSNAWHDKIFSTTVLSTKR